MMNWCLSRCQTKTLTEQLHEGIRYFDFRVMPVNQGLTTSTVFKVTSFCLVRKFSFLFVCVPIREFESPGQIRSSMSACVC